MIYWILLYYFDGYDRKKFVDYPNYFFNILKINS